MADEPIRPTHQKVSDIFAHLQTGEGEKFFEHVADDVSWTVMGTHPLAGHYNSKDEFTRNTFERLNRIMPDGIALSVDNVLVDSNTAVVEMTANAQGLRGQPFPNKYCWVCEFEGDMIHRVRAYLDSALVGFTVAANEEILRSRGKLAVQA